MIAVVFSFDDGSEMEVQAEAGDSLMSAAVAAGVPGIIAECGGGAICGTCHVHVDAQWRSATGPALPDEEDTLDTVPALTASSRLACQIVVSESMAGLRTHVPGAVARRKAS